MHSSKLENMKCSRWFTKVRVLSVPCPVDIQTRRQDKPVTFVISTPGIFSSRRLVPMLNALIGSVWSRLYCCRCCVGCLLWSTLYKYSFPGARWRDSLVDSRMIMANLAKQRPPDLTKLFTVTGIDDFKVFYPLFDLESVWGSMLAKGSSSSSSANNPGLKNLDSLIDSPRCISSRR